MLRARSQLLHRPRRAPEPADVLRAIGGAQSQQARAGRLQVRARSRRLTAGAVERARVEERSILRHWVMRMTVHLIPAEDLGWLAPLFADRIQGASRRRLQALGVRENERERGLDAVRQALKDGPLTRSEALERAAKAGYPVSAETRTHLAMLLVTEGAACIGPDQGREGTYVASEDWLGTIRRRGREESLAELARRYFAAFGPANERDMAAWSGLALRDCRAGIGHVARELDELRCDGEVMLAPRGWTARAPSFPVVRLLPAFDTYLMGYASRSHAVDPDGERRVLPGGGILRPTICVDGRFVGLWSSRRSGKRLTVELEPFESLADPVLAAIESEVDDIGRFEAVEARLG